MLPGEASKGPGVEQEGREGSRQGCYSRCRSSLSLASPGALGHEWHGWLCLSSRQGPGPSQSHSVPAAVGKETWTLGPSDAAWGWQASLQHRRYQPPETRQGGWCIESRGIQTECQPHALQTEGQGRGRGVSNTCIRNTDLGLCSTVSPYKLPSRWKHTNSQHKETERWTR